MRAVQNLARDDVPRQLDDALAQPTRARLFALLNELRRPAGTEELSERLELHPNGVRAHLARLHGAGLVSRERIRQARGRPRDMWMVAPDARPGGDPPSGYADLARWLARVIATHKTPNRAAEGTGRKIGRELAPDDDWPSEEKLHAVLASLGFQPRREATPGRLGLSAVQLSVSRRRAREPGGDLRAAPRDDARTARRAGTEHGADRLHTA